MWKRFARHLLAEQLRPWCRALLVILVIVVSWFAFKPASGPLDFEQQDKLQHIAAFASLALVASLGWVQAAGRRAPLALGLLGYGAFIELVQTQLPTRTGSLDDWLADAAGTAIGLGLAQLLRRLGEKNS